MKPMIDDKFAASAFAGLGRDSKDARDLADLLQDAVTVEMQLLIKEKFGQIVAKLNSMGHDLRLYDDLRPGEISFRDDNEENGNYSCKLRLGFDYVTSAGYSDTIESE